MKVNVNLSLQIRIAHSYQTSILAVNENTVRVFYRTQSGVHFIDLIDKEHTGEASKCELTTDLDQAGKWFRVVGTGNFNKTNIIKAFRMIKK